MSGFEWMKSSADHIRRSLKPVDATLATETHVGGEPAPSFTFDLGSDLAGRSSNGELSTSRLWWGECGVSY